jgi:ribulose-phosphate 3-epimerase
MIVPALLSDSREELAQMLVTCESFAPCVQIDVMDGEFVPSTSIGPADLFGLSFKGKSEAHVMAKDPLFWIERFAEFGSFRFIFHFEIDADHSRIIQIIKKQGMEAGLAVNPSTAIEEFESLLDQVDSVLFMSVNPGFYGATFLSEVLAKVSDFKRRYPAKIAGIDGCIKLDNLADVAATGVDYICVGSAVLKAESPAKAYTQMVDLTKKR